MQSIRQKFFSHVFDLSNGDQLRFNYPILCLQECVNQYFKRVLTLLFLFESVECFHLLSLPSPPGCAFD